MSAPAPAGNFAVHAACIRGVEAVPVTVEVSISGGVPGMCIIGLGDAVLLDTRVRVKSAMKAGGFEVPRQFITVNLAPGDMRKSGTGFDLPIMIAILAISNQIPRDGLDECLFVGELGLDGRVCPMRGEVAYALYVRDAGLTLVGGWDPAHVAIDGARMAYLAGSDDLRAGIEDATRPYPPDMGYARKAVQPDFSDVVGQEIAKRAMAISATGGLGMLMVGSPGSGKTMLARRMTTILPPIEPDEQLEALCIHSVVGEAVEGLLAGERPFRNPHHSISGVGLVGGGRPPHPGEISLAHGGVLFLDELAEFPNNVLQLLRQPMEEGLVRIVRSEGAFTFASRFQLLAASNPCPCGYLGDREVTCRCSAAVIDRYQMKLAGPLADRIDLSISIARPAPELIVAGEEGLSSADLRELVVRGRAFADWRAMRTGADTAADGLGSMGTVIEDYAIDADGEQTLLDIARRAHLTGRGITRLCRIARTIADMAECERVGVEQVMEASMYQGRLGDGC